MQQIQSLEIKSLWVSISFSSFCLFFVWRYYVLEIWFTALAGIPKDTSSSSSHLIVILIWYHLHNPKYACQLGNQGNFITKTGKKIEIGVYPCWKRSRLWNLWMYMAISCTASNIATALTLRECGITSGSHFAGQLLYFTPTDNPSYVQR